LLKPHKFMTIGMKGLSETWVFRGIILTLIVASGAGLLDEYTLHLLTIASLFTILAFGQDVAFGDAGILLLCQGAFFGLSAYCSALMVERLHLAFWTSFPIVVLGTGAVGAFVGWITSRIAGHYLAMFTMGISVIFQQLVLNWTSLTGGASGLSTISRPQSLSLFGLQLSFENNRTYLVLCAVLLLFVVESIRLLRKSRLGKLFLAIREDEVAARSLGIKASQVKVVAMMIAASLAGVSGPLYAHYQRLISPEDFSVFQSVSILLMVILGGSGSLIGPLIGATLVILLPEYLRPVENFRWIVFGSVLILCIIFLPGGIREGIIKLARKLRPV
jgi:branched-chain amino acid transport system permease protein